MNKFSLRQFRLKYGSHIQCLEAIKQARFPDPFTCPKCKTIQKFYRVKERTSYACNNCGHHIYPLAGTIFEKSTTPLDLWFFAMYLMVQTRSGTSAKQLERMLGVTYKTAWRMFKQIRMLMSEGGLPLDGVVEIDETFIGGKGKNRAFEDFSTKEKQVVMGMIQREGKAYFKHIASTGKWAILEQIQNHVSPKAKVITDEWRGYTQIPQYGYQHHEVVSHKMAEYVRGEIHTQNIESFWSGLKRGIYGVYRKVSKKYLQAYVDEYAFRYNHRNEAPMMFDILFSQITSVRSLKAEKLV